MENEAIKILKEGRRFIDPIMEVNGFHWEAGRAGKSSGGFSDSGQYVKGARKLELHFRHSLGMVTYHIGNVALSHEDYMRYVAGKGKAEYPGFSKDPLGAFKQLANDLTNFASDFLSGTGDEFIKAKEKSDEREKLSGFKKVFGD